MRIKYILLGLVLTIINVGITVSLHLFREDLTIFNNAVNIGLSIVFFSILQYLIITELFIMYLHVKYPRNLFYRVEIYKDGICILKSPMLLHDDLLVTHSIFESLKKYNIKYYKIETYENLYIGSEWVKRIRRMYDTKERSSYSHKQE